MRIKEENRPSDQSVLGKTEDSKSNKAADSIQKGDRILQ